MSSRPMRFIGEDDLYGDITAVQIETIFVVLNVVTQTGLQLSVRVPNRVTLANRNPISWVHGIVCASKHSITIAMHNGYDQLIDVTSNGCKVYVGHDFDRCILKEPQNRDRRMIRGIGWGYNPTGPFASHVVSAIHNLMNKRELWGGQWTEEMISNLAVAMEWVKHAWKRGSEGRVPIGIDQLTGANALVEFVKQMNEAILNTAFDPRVSAWWSARMSGASVSLANNETSWCISAQFTQPTSPRYIDVDWDYPDVIERPMCRNRFCIIEVLRVVKSDQGGGAVIVGKTGTGHEVELKNVPLGVGSESINQRIYVLLQNMETRYELSMWGGTIGGLKMLTRSVAMSPLLISGAKDWEEMSFPLPLHMDNDLSRLFGHLSETSGRLCNEITGGSPCVCFWNVAETSNCQDVLQYLHYQLDAFSVLSRLARSRLLHAVGNVALSVVWKQDDEVSYADTCVFKKILSLVVRTVKVLEEKYASNTQYRPLLVTLRCCIRRMTNMSFLEPTGVTSILLPAYSWREDDQSRMERVITGSPLNEIFSMYPRPSSSRFRSDNQSTVDAEYSQTVFWAETRQSEANNLRRQGVRSTLEPVHLTRAMMGSMFEMGRTGDWVTQMPTEQPTPVNAPQVEHTVMNDAQESADESTSTQSESNIRQPRSESGLEGLIRRHSRFYGLSGAPASLQFVPGDDSPRWLSMSGLNTTPSAPSLANQSDRVVMSNADWEGLVKLYLPYAREFQFLGDQYQMVINNLLSRTIAASDLNMMTDKIIEIVMKSGMITPFLNQHGYIAHIAERYEAVKKRYESARPSASEYRAMEEISLLIPELDAKMGVTVQFNLPMELIDRMTLFKMAQQPIPTPFNRLQLDLFFRHAMDPAKVEIQPHMRPYIVYMTEFFGLVHTPIPDQTAMGRALESIVNNVRLLGASAGSLWQRIPDAAHVMTTPSDITPSGLAKMSKRSEPVVPDDFFVDEITGEVIPNMAKMVVYNEKTGERYVVGVTTAQSMVMTGWCIQS